MCMFVCFIDMPNCISMQVIYLRQCAYHCMTMFMYVNAAYFNLSTSVNTSVYWVNESGCISCVYKCGCLCHGVGFVADSIFQR